MGKKPATKKPEAKKAAPKKKAGAVAPPKKAAPAAKAPAAKKQPVAKSAKKPAPRVAEKPAAKPKAKPPAKPAPKPAPAAKSAPSGKKAATKPAPDAKKSPTKGGKAAEPVVADAKGDAASLKKGRKGITIVTPKPVKKAPKHRVSGGSVPALSGSILGMGIGSGKPLIPSAPAGSVTSLPESESGKKPKSPFNKRQLEKYQEILVAKRKALLGDIDSMETEALRSQSGSLSHLPQHMAEQGSETYEQSLSLDLAAADRQLLREIDAALLRIELRTYGICERTGKEISKERLAELPWARFSIEAAREMERRIG